MKQKQKISITLAIKLFSIAALALILAVILYLSGMANNSLRNQAAKLNHATLTSFCERVESSLAVLDKYLYDMFYHNNSLSVLDIGSSDQERYLAKMELSSSLSQIVDLHDLAEGVFVYSPNGDEDEFITRTSRVLSMSESKAIRSRITDAIKQDSVPAALSSAGWYIDRIDAKNYFLHVIDLGSAYCGAWVSASALFEALEEIDFGEGEISLICDKDGFPLTDSPVQSLSLDPYGWQERTLDSRHYLQVSAQPASCAFAAAALIPMEAISQEWNDSLQVVWICAAVLLILMGAFLLSSRSVYRPFKALVTAMRRVGDADLDVRITQQTRLAEFDQVYGIFNAMVREIKDLKISIYEQKLNEQKIKQQYLQIQLKSHFYLNCLNIIYSLAQVKDYELIQQLTLCLVKYFRYMMQDASHQPTIQEELAHVNNYMQIQALRFEELISYDPQVDDGCLPARVPPLMLHTFVENAVEHALDFDQHNVIRLSVTSLNRDGRQMMRIVISDNGPGFPEKILAQLNRQQPVIKTDYQKRIGINNIMDRLHLMYGDRASLTFSNAEPHGAQVEILLPLVLDDPDKETRPGSV